MVQSNASLQWVLVHTVRVGANTTVAAGSQQYGSPPPAGTESRTQHWQPVGYPAGPQAPPGNPSQNALSIPSHCSLN